MKRRLIDASAKRVRFTLCPIPAVEVAVWSQDEKKKDIA
jgi:hypothetical protein